jgi:signal transduction histidine kinase
LILNLNDDLPEVTADANRIRQVLVNLLQNAISHTSEGTITISAEAADDFVKISVADTGEGIETERLPIIFERFKSRDSGIRIGNKRATGRGAGTGLGLYICRHIVEAHGGRIVVSSEVGAGTEVSFTIPACP